MVCTNATVIDIENLLTPTNTVLEDISAQAKGAFIRAHAHLTGINIANHPAGQELLRSLPCCVFWLMLSVGASATS